MDCVSFLFFSFFFCMEFSRQAVGCWIINFGGYLAGGISSFCMYKFFKFKRWLGSTGQPTRECQDCALVPRPLWLQVSVMLFHHGSCGKFYRATAPDPDRRTAPPGASRYRFLRPNTTTGEMHHRGALRYRVSRHNNDDSPSTEATGRGKTFF